MALEKEVATDCNILAWRIPWMGSLVGCRPWGHRESGTTESDLASCGRQDLQSSLWHEEPLSRGMQTLSCDMLDLVS